MLWVCNTVARVMDAADRAQDLAPSLYHSRFKYEDRVKRHRAVVDAFDPKTERWQGARHLFAGRRNEP